MSTSDTVSVIIVTCNSQTSIATCLDKLVSGTSHLTTQIIIVDNASTDGTVETIHHSLPNATVVANQNNVGFAQACNQGADAAIGEFLLFVNPDLEIDSDAVSNLIAVSTSTPRAGLVAGRLRYPDGTFQANCRNFPTVTNLLFSRGSVMTRLFLNRFSTHRGLYSLPDFDEVTEVPAVAATLALIRRNLFKKLKGFDPSFFLYMEDTDLSIRLHYAGFVNLFVPHAGGVHGFGQGARVGRLKRSFYQHQSVWKYFLKHFPNGFSLFVLPVILTANFILSAIIPKRGQ